MRARMTPDDKKKVNSNEMMSKLADLWKNLEDEERKKYQDMAEKEKIKYLLESNEFYQNHPYDVIQNKTKNNHVKKSCSAYGLFLKDTKNIIKASNPELKMSEILKIVSQKWKELPEDKRKAYQKQAKAEKEAAQAKLEEQFDPANLAKNDIALPQKRLKSQKRVKRALYNESIKLSDASSSDVFTVDGSYASSPSFETMFTSPSETNENENPTGFNSNINEDFFLQKVPSFSLNMNRALSIEPIFSSLKEEEKYQSTGFLTDLINYHPGQEVRTFDFTCSNDYNMINFNMDYPFAEL